MSDEGKVLHLPTADELVECHLRLPNFAQAKRENSASSSSMLALASMFQETSERFDVLAEIFGECGRAGYSPDSYFIHGSLTFVFQVPRRYLPRLLEEGWGQDEVDV
jgi:hypothetical protein